MKVNHGQARCSGKQKKTCKCHELSIFVLNLFRYFIVVFLSQDNIKKNKNTIQIDCIGWMDEC